jgi:MYXO-CTERM domain-containing protein
MRTRLLFAAVAVLSLLVCLNAAAAAVITFDDLSVGSVPAGYAGLTWGTSTDDTYSGNTGYWYATSDTGYSTPHSPENYVYNAWGANNLWFSFAAPVDFEGAWFAKAGAYSNATQVRVKDDLGNISSWLDLTSTPQYLAADFSGASKIWVQRQGGSDAPQWYTMDDVTYDEDGGGDSHGSPELSTWMLLACSGLAGLAFRRRRS